MAERKSRRVRTEPVPGSDPTPQVPHQVVRAAEDADESWGERRTPREGPNDEQLRRDVPPHY
jgi:high-mobility group nucleosome-binding domain-containing protein 2